MIFKRKILSILVILSGFSVLYAQDLPERPTPPRLVVDFANILSPDQEGILEQKLVHFNDTTSNQILVITTDDLLGYTPETYASGIGDKWGVGQEETDNGVVVLVKPGTGNNDGRVWISVGYGLEGVIPDITAGHIIDWEMIPYFEQNRYYEGLDAATTVLMELAAEEYNSDEYASRQNKGWWGVLPFFFIILIFILISRASKRSRTIGSRSMSPWTAFWIGSMMGGSSRWGGGSSGNSWGGGGFGGGSSFGGFGGGGFGGGGAGGSW